MALNNFSWVIPNKLAGSDVPGRSGQTGNELDGDVRFLSENGIKCLVSLERPDGNIEKICDLLGIEWVFFPIKDFSVPNDLEIFDNLVIDIINYIENEKPVCVHCHAGIGRTGLVLSCVMGKYFSLDPRKAIAAVRKKRTSLDTHQQEQFVKAYLNSYEN